LFDAGEDTGQPDETLQDADITSKNKQQNGF
jgi:hypothetical protein